MLKWEGVRKGCSDLRIRCIDVSTGRILGYISMDDDTSLMASYAVTSIISDWRGSYISIDSAKAAFERYLTESLVVGEGA